jgi:hypothetical protein
MDSEEELQLENQAAANADAHDLTSQDSPSADEETTDVADADAVAAEGATAADTAERVSRKAEVIVGESLDVMEEYYPDEDEAVHTDLAEEGVLADEGVHVSKGALADEGGEEEPGEPLSAAILEIE